MFTDQVEIGLEVSINDYFPSLVFRRRQKSKEDGLKWSDFGERWVSTNFLPPIWVTFLRYVPAGRPISVPSPFDKSPVQWYRLTPNKQSIGSSLSITFSSPNVGEIVSYIVESQVARTDFTFHFIGVPALEEKQRTVYAVFGFPLKVQLSNSIQQVRGRVLLNSCSDNLFDIHDCI